jgi:hypothetical protein
MRHARPDDLERLMPLLEQLRTIDALKEKSPGSFYRKSKGFLHFHIDGDDVFADVRLTDGGDFERRRVTTKTEQKALLTAVRHATQ